VHHEAPRATFDQLARVHPRSHIEHLSAISPNEGLVRVDPDTAMCPDTFEAALRAAGLLHSELGLEATPVRD
jgi:acetoin utilization deacetylase AcuC-like enzyme